MVQWDQVIKDDSKSLGRTKGFKQSNTEEEYKGIVGLNGL